MYAWNPMCSEANFRTWFGRSHLIICFRSYTCVYRSIGGLRIRRRPTDGLEESCEKHRQGGPALANFEVA